MSKCTRLREYRTGAKGAHAEAFQESSRTSAATRAGTSFADTHACIVAGSEQFKLQARTLRARLRACEHAWLSARLGVFPQCGCAHAFGAPLSTAQRCAHRPLQPIRIGSCAHGCLSAHSPHSACGPPSPSLALSPLGLLADTLSRLGAFLLRRRSTPLRLSAHRRAHVAVRASPYSALYPSGPPDSHIACSGRAVRQPHRRMPCRRNRTHHRTQSKRHNCARTHPHARTHARTHARIS